ncbi:hypothetical protein ACIF6K_30915 [Streptomyces sp. NPDC085942]|uniref:hypothetical protein n=1 Tax=Streptomyces sp. NPDC085942 TaxID=3365743 RepID=UPI0037D40545
MATAARTKLPARRKPTRARKNTPQPKPSAPPVETVVPATVPVVRAAADPVIADARDRAADMADFLLDQARTDTARLLADAEAHADARTDDARRQAAALRTNAEAMARQVLAEVVEESGRRLAEATTSAAAVQDQARNDVEQLHTEARTRTARQRAEAALAARRIEDEAKGQAEQLLTAARTEADQILARAHAEADRLTQAATQCADEAAEAARERLETAGAEAAEQIAAAERRSTDVLAEAEKAAAALTTRAESNAARLRERAEVEAAQLREDAGRDEEAARRSAARLRKLAEEDIARLRATAAEDAERLTRNARAEAERILAQADARKDIDLKEAADVLARARVREADAEVTLKAAHDKAAEAGERMRRALDRTERRIERKRLKAEARQERAEARDTRKARIRELRAAARAGKPTRTERVKKFVRVNAERLLVILPITAPMAVAWTGQAGFAKDILGWEAPWTILFAAAFELSTAFVGWMYHQARKDGDAGTLYRIATWIFAMGAALMNFWHASGMPKEGTRVWDETANRFVQEITYWHFTPKAVAFATMSIVGMALWELYATLLHRRKLREDGKVAKARPSIGIVRWVRYPRHAFTAWSLAITDASLTTLNHTWYAAERELTHRRTLRSARQGSPLPATYRVLPLNGSPNPGQVPNFFVNLTRTDLPDQANRLNGEPDRNRPALLPPPDPNHPGANHRFGNSEPALPPGTARTGDGPGNGRAANQQNANREPGRDATANLTSRSQQQAEQVEQVLNLIDELGYDSVKLRVVQERTGMTKTTAYHRLNDARDAYHRREAG